MSSPNYNKKGICTNSTFLRAKLNLNELDCLTVCQNYDGCNYVTFRHDNTNLCLLFQTCSELDIDSCPTCLTGPFAQSQVRAQFSGEQLRGWWLMSNEDWAGSKSGSTQDIVEGVEPNVRPLPNVKSPLLPEVENNMKFPLHMECLVLFLSSFCSECDKITLRVLPNSPSS